MNLSKAIEINTEVAEMRGKRTTAEKREALWLGIEALKQVQFYRSFPNGKYHNLLPDETED